MIDFNTQAIEQFNQGWKKGFRYLEANGLALDAPSIAHFLKANKDKLDFEQLGECLSDHTQAEVLKAYVNLMGFNGATFTNALRSIMTEFKFPGEAQKIDRVMEAFGNEYCAANSNNPHSEFKDGEAVYVLAFSCVMLNTDSHNPSIQNKITLEQFIKNNRGINQGKDFSRELLTEIYKDITRREIKCNDESILSEYQVWAKGQGEYRFGFLTKYYILGDTQAKKESENSLVEMPKPIKSEEENYNDWSQGKGGYQFGYLTSYYLWGRQTTNVTNATGATATPSSTNVNASKTLK